MFNLKQLGVAVPLALLALGSAQANVANGSLWIVPEASSQNATLANVPATAADVTFSVNTPFNFTSNLGYTISDFLASSSSFNIAEHTAGTLSSFMDTGGHGTLIYFTGMVSVTNGQQFTVTHDDGLTLIIGGTNLNANPGPTAPSVNTYTYNGPSGNQTFQLVYGECCGAPAVLQVDLPLAAVPEPETYALMFAGLGAVGVGVARRRRA